jgi:pilus assembly protein FimV
VVIAGLLTTALWLMHQHKKVLSQLDVSGIYQPSSSADELIVLPKNDASTQHNLHNPLAGAQQLVADNRLSEAAQLLKTQIESAPKASLLARLYLLRLLRDLSWEDDFEKYANELHQRYNVLTPMLSHQALDLEIPTCLEAFPHILEQLQQHWPTPAAASYLQDLLVDNRGGDRMGFSEDVLEEMAILLEVHALRNAP